MGIEGNISEKIVSEVMTEKSVTGLLTEKSLSTTWQDALLDNLGPAVVSAEVGLIDDHTIDLLMDENPAAIVPDIADFVPLFSGGDVSISDVTIDGLHIYLSLSRSIEYGETGTIAYIPGDNKLQDAEGNPTSAFNKEVTNNVEQIADNPILQTVILKTESTIELTYDINLDESSIPASDTFNVLINSIANAVTNVAISAKAVTLSLTNKCYWGDSGSVAYTKPGSNMIKSVSGGQAESFESTPASNVISLEAETTVLLTAGRYNDAPTDALKALINKTIVDLKSDGVFQMADCMYIRGVHESLLACQNWIKNAHNSTLFNNPTFTPKVGFSGDGSTSYINNNYNPKSHADKLALGDVTMCWLQHTLGSTTGRYILGCNDTTGTSARMYLLYYTTGNDRMYLNSGTYNGNVNCEADKVIGFSRISGQNQGYVDGYASGAVTLGVTDGELPEFDIYELCANLNGSPNGFNNGNIMFSFYGKGLNATQMLALYTRIKYFFDNVGGTF